MKVSEVNRFQTTVKPANKHGKYVCNVAICGKVFDQYPHLLKHMKEHIIKGTVVTCPHLGCSKVYKLVNSFTSHLSRYHRGVVSEVGSKDLVLPSNSVEEVIDLGNRPALDLEMDILENLDDNNLNCEQDSPDDIILKAISQYCMKLEFQNLVPENTIQKMVTEMYLIHSQSLELLKNNLTKAMISEGLSKEKTQSILFHVLSDDPFSKHFGANLKSKFRRKTLYKSIFPFVKPVRVKYSYKIKSSLATEESEDEADTTEDCEVEEGMRRVKSFFMYVPIKETLKALFLDKSMKVNLDPPVVREDGILEDITDGQIYKRNQFFQDNPNALRYVLYQDGFELVNPIGPAKTKHKLVGIYLSILNLPDYLRSHINSIYLVGLYKEKHFDHDSIYGHIVKDLKDLETEGIDIPGVGNVKAGLVCIIGDNKGSHELGGFVANFSTAVYFCRFCNLDRPTFDAPGGECVEFPKRTPETYNEALRLGVGSKYGYMGIKFNSKFNELLSFHVCNPGLPSCYGHDLMEGVVIHDLKLFITYFIDQEWFSLDQLNEAIENFPYSTEDGRDRPAKLSVNQQGVIKLCGGAWQIWTFLRLFPLIINNYIKDEYDEYWIALMKLTELVEIVCAPKIHISHLGFLDALCHDYISSRKELFPTVRLRPKHHYLTHYALLIYLFGPLIKVWTLRFESKHSFFKRTAHAGKNFINILFSLSMRHELLQCFLRSGAEQRCPVKVRGGVLFQPSNYCTLLQNAVSSVLPLNQLECDKVWVKGTAYVKGGIVVLSQDSYEYNTKFGRICVMLYDCSTDSVFLVCSVLETTYQPLKRVYQVGSEKKLFVCMNQDNILCYYPLATYRAGRHQFIKLKHGLVSKREH